MTGHDAPDLPEALRSQFRRSNVALALSRAEGDVPLVLVNDAFSRLTGYSDDECRGRNCRFLQGPATGAEERLALRRFVHDASRDAGRFPVLNYRKDGRRFVNFVFMSRLRDGAGRTRFVLASQFDMTEVHHRVRLPENDAELGRRLSDIDAIGRGFGLAMLGSAEALAQSAAMLAQLSLDDIEGGAPAGASSDGIDDG